MRLSTVPRHGSNRPASSWTRSRRGSNRSRAGQPVGLLLWSQRRRAANAALLSFRLSPRGTQSSHKLGRELFVRRQPLGEAPAVGRVPLLIVHSLIRPLHRDAQRSVLDRRSAEHAAPSDSTLLVQVLDFWPIVAPCPVVQRRASSPVGKGGEAVPQEQIATKASAWLASSGKRTSLASWSLTRLLHCCRLSGSPRAAGPRSSPSARPGGQQRSRPPHRGSHTR
jgi:hypothetical protein